MARRVVVATRVEPEIAALLKECARRRGVTLAELMRSILSRVAGECP